MIRVYFAVSSKGFCSYTFETSVIFNLELKFDILWIIFCGDPNIWDHRQEWEEKSFLKFHLPQDKAYAFRKRKQKPAGVVAYFLLISRFQYCLPACLLLYLQACLGLRSRNPILSWGPQVPYSDVSHLGSFPRRKSQVKIISINKQYIK